MDQESDSREWHGEKHRQKQTGSDIDRQNDTNGQKETINYMFLYFLKNTLLYTVSFISTLLLFFYMWYVHAQLNDH